MCGRASCTLSASAVCKATGCNEEEWVRQDEYTPNINAHPGNRLPIILAKPMPTDEAESSNSSKIQKFAGRYIETSAWGLVPSYTKQVGKATKPNHFRMFNARSDRLKQVHARLMKPGAPGKRCVGIVDGFYEWKTEGGVKIPYYIQHEDGRPMFIAGLRDVWEPKQKDAEDNPEDRLVSHAMITVDSHKSLRWLHHRMPAILPTEADVAAWLAPDPDVSVLRPTNGLKWYAVTTRLNKIQYHGDDCRDPVQPTKNLKSFFGSNASASSSNSPPDSSARVKNESSTSASDKNEKQIKKSKIGVHAKGEGDVDTLPEGKEEPCTAASNKQNKKLKANMESENRTDGQKRQHAYSDGAGVKADTDAGSSPKDKNKSDKSQFGEEVSHKTDTQTKNDATIETDKETHGDPKVDDDVTDVTDVATASETDVKPNKIGAGGKRKSPAKRKTTESKKGSLDSIWSKRLRK